MSDDFCNLGCVLRDGNYLHTWAASCPEGKCEASKCVCELDYHLLLYNRPYIFTVRSNVERSKGETDFTCDMTNCNAVLLDNIVDNDKFTFKTIPDAEEIDPTTIDNNTTLFWEFIPTHTSLNGSPIYADDVFFVNWIHGSKRYPVGFKREGNCVILTAGGKRAKFSWEPEFFDQLSGIAWSKHKRLMDINLRIYDTSNKQWYHRGPWKTDDGRLLYAVDHVKNCPDIANAYYSRFKLIDYSLPVGYKPMPPPQPLRCNIIVGKSVVSPPCPAGMQCVQNWCVKNPDPKLIAYKRRETRDNITGLTEQVEDSEPSSSTTTSTVLYWVIGLFVIMLLVGLFVWYIIKHRK